MNIINTNDKDATGGEITLTTEKSISLYATSRSGGSKQFKLGVQVSPDAGATWVTLPHLLTGTGCLHLEIIATKARIIVMQAEGSSSSIDAMLLAR